MAKKFTLELDSIQEVFLLSSLAMYASATLLKTPANQQAATATAMRKARDISGYNNSAGLKIMEGLAEKFSELLKEAFQAVAANETDPADKIPPS